VLAVNKRIGFASYNIDAGSHYATMEVQTTAILDGDYLEVFMTHSGAAKFYSSGESGEAIQVFQGYLITQT